MKEIVIARVPSLSDARVRYDITDRGGELHCSCQAFYSWKKRGLKCWHLRVFDSSARALERCWTEHETPEGFLCRTCLLALLSAMTGTVKSRYIDKEEAKAKVKQARASRKKKPKEKTHDPS